MLELIYIKTQLQMLKFFNNIFQLFHFITSDYKRWIIVASLKYQIIEKYHKS